MFEIVGKSTETTHDNLNLAFSYLIQILLFLFFTKYITIITIWNIELNFFFTEYEIILFCDVPLLLYWQQHWTKLRELQERPDPSEQLVSCSHEQRHIW